MNFSKKLFPLLIALCFIISLFPPIQVSAACSHTYGTNQYYEVSHPHKYYYECTKCGAKAYTGYTTTLPHGSSSSGGCPSCGTHSYSQFGIPQTSHPHEVKYRCNCGSSYSTYPLDQFCSSCTINSLVAQSSTPTQGVLVYIAGDHGLGIPVTIPVTFYVEYTNTYSHPSANYPMLNYGYPAFASWSSRVTSYCNNLGPNDPYIYYMSSTTVKYYNQSNSCISTQQLTISGNDAIGIYKHCITSNPSYCTSSAMCSLDTSGDYVQGSTRTNFS